MKLIKLIASIAVSLAAGLIGGIFTASSIPTWYATLNKPSWNPPNWLFGPVWTLLYILMGISLYLIWQSRPALRSQSEGGGATKKIALILFGLQLTLNLFWSIIFFGLQRPDLALVEILILWLTIITLIFKTYPLSKPTAYLLLPYLLWVSFATILNTAIVMLN